MKKWLIPWLCLLLCVAPGRAENAPDFAALSGLDRVQAALERGAAVETLTYGTGTKIARGFILDDPREIGQMLAALESITIAGPVDEFVTDMYPRVTLRLSDGSECVLDFDGRWLRAAGVNYTLENDGPFWTLVDQLMEKYDPDGAPPERFIPNSVDLYLPSNPTTGFTWLAQAETEGVVAVTDLYFADPAPLGMTGAGGVHWFHLDGLTPGVTAVTLTYGRSWEENPIRTIVYRLTVDEQLNVLVWGIEEKSS